ncbi:hypothetical protein, partial [Erwinia amylovora]|uniref:hypothetical protein n=1 Tax=Erwinia amylovora TaxID=552 RepID=UPI0020BEE0B9
LISNRSIAKYSRPATPPKRPPPPKPPKPNTEQQKTPDKQHQKNTTITKDLCHITFYFVRTRALNINKNNKITLQADDKIKNHQLNS